MKVIRLSIFNGSMKVKQIHIVLGIMLLHLVLCLFAINSFPIALDEPFSIFHSQKEIGDLIKIFETENNPPLHFVLLHFWIKSFGISAISVRLLSLLFSLLTIPFLIKLVTRLVDLKTAAFVSLLFVFSNFQHYHAIEARTYALLVFLFVLILYDLYRFIFEKNKWLFLRLGIWNAALLYTHYLGGFILGVELLMLAFFYKKMSVVKLKQIGLGTIITVILYIPGIKLFLIRMDSFTGAGTWVPEAQFSELYGNILRFLNGKFSFIGILLIIVVLVVVNRNRIKSHLKLKTFITGKYAFAIAAFLFSYLGMFIVSKVVEPIFLDRYLLYTSIPLYICLGIVFHVAGAGLPKWVSFISLVPVILFFKWIPDNNREPNLVAEWVSSVKTPTTQVVICPAFYELSFMYHYNQQVFKDYNNWNAYKSENHIDAVYSMEAIDWNPEVDAVIYIDSDAGFLYPNNGIIKSIESKFAFSKSASFAGGVNVFLYK